MRQGSGSEGPANGERGHRAPSSAADCGPATGADAGHPARSPTALVVDDEPYVRRHLARIFSRAGYGVLEAETGENALSASAHWGRPIDLLVTDVHMPGISGWDLAARLRRERPDLKILLLSGADPGPRRALEPGVAFLRKPLAGATLVEHARRLLALR